MLRSKLTLGAALLVLPLFLTSPLAAEMQVEDFEGGNGSGGFNNPVFIHDIQRDEILGNVDPAWEFTDLRSISPTHSLHLIPGTDYITFDLANDEFIDYAEVWMAGSSHIPAHFHVLGLDESGAPFDVLYTSPSDDSWAFFSTEGAGFSVITELRLTTFKLAWFDSAGVNVVPEPATFGLLAIGFVALARRVPRRNRR